MVQAIGTWRYRLNLTNTVREGWRVGDVTVEFTETAGISEGVPREEVRRRATELIEEGEQIATQRNADKQRAQAFN